MASENVTILSDENFSDTISAEGEPVLVDFWAEWCGPCKMIAPILDEIADEQVGSVKIAKLNVEGSTEVGTGADNRGTYLAVANRAKKAYANIPALTDQANAGRIGGCRHRVLWIGYYSADHTHGFGTVTQREITRRR